MMVIGTNGCKGIIKWVVTDPLLQSLQVKIPFQVCAVRHKLLR
jgi:hypothetical protein